MSHNLVFLSLESASPHVFIECISVINFVTCLHFITLKITLKITYQHQVDDTCFDLRRASDAVSDALLPLTLGTLAFPAGTQIDFVFNQQIIACSKWDIFAVLSGAVQGYVKRLMLLNSFINATSSFCCRLRFALDSKNVIILKTVSCCSPVAVLSLCPVACVHSSKLVQPQVLFFVVLHKSQLILV